MTTNSIPAGQRKASQRHREGAREAVCHLIAHGHRRIAFLGETAEFSTVQDRLAGMAAGLSDVLQQAPDLAALRIMSGIVGRQAEVMAFNDLLLMLAGIMALAVLLLPFVRR